MGFAEAVTRRPWVVILVWIIIAGLAFPLFINLHKVVKEEMYTLPSSSESMKAMNLMKKIRAGNETHTGLIIVDGISLTDNETLLKLTRIMDQLNRSVMGRYVSKLNALPLILAETNKTIYKELLKALNQSSAGAARLYETLEALDKAYAEALDNATKQVKQLNESLKGLMAADKGYVEAYKGLVALRDTLNKTISGLVELDSAYTEATNKVSKLASNLTRLAKALQAMDSAYSSLYRNITGSAQRLVGVLSNKTLVASVEQGLGYTWWQVSRAYYYLDKLGGNYTAYAKATNLSRISPELAPLPKTEALEAWKAVKSLVASGLDPDEAAAVVAAKLFSEKMSHESRIVLQAAGEAWNQSLVAYKRMHNITCITCLYALGNTAAKSQLTVLSIARNISSTAATYVVENARTIAAELLAAMLSKNMPKQLAQEIAREAAESRLEPAKIAELVAGMAAEKQGLPTNTSRALAGLLVKYDPGANYTIAENWAVAVKAAGELVSGMGAPRGLVEALVELLSKNPEPGREELANIAASIVAEKAGEKARPLLEEITRVDPEARGLVAANKTLAAKLAANIVYEAAEKQGKKLDKALVERIALLLVRGDARDDDLRRIALEILEENIARSRGEDAAKTIATVLERFDPLAEGRLAANKTLAIEALYWLAEKQEHRIPFPPSQLEEALSNPAKLKPLVAKMFINMSTEKAPEKMRPLVRELAGIVVEKGPGIPSSEKWSIVKKLLLEQAKEMKQAKGMALPPRLRDRVVELAIMVAQHRIGLEEAAKKLSEEILLGSIAPKLVNEAKGLMVSRDLKAFSIMVVPLGNTQEERAKNIEAVGNTTAKLLARNHLRASIYVSGEDILLQQVRQYAIKDAEKTSKLSELGTFIVLLVLLESFFAVFLPYIGIILGLAVGGAIVYIAASHGIIDFSSHTQSVMMTTALGLGADYAGYLIYRFKEEYALVGDAREAARRSLKRAGPAIVASATTVIIGFGSLLLAWDISFLRGFGEAIPIAVAATATATLTLVPALLALVGNKRWFWWPRRPRKEKVLERRSRVMASLLRHEKLVLTAMAALILVSGYFYATFHGTHDMKLMLPEKAPALKAFNIMSEKFEAGITDPVFIVVGTKKSIWSDPGTWKLLEGLVDEIARLKGVGTVMAPTRPMGRPVGNITQAKDMGGEAFTSSDGRLALIQVILSVDPYSKDGEKTIRDIHRLVHQYAETHGLRVYVDGSPYATLEMDDILTKEFYQRVLPGAALLMILAFTLIFGGLWVSVAALIVIIGAAMTGIMASILLFKYVFGKDMLWFMHIITLAAVMGVGMDYNSFFLARALEECHKTNCDPKESVIRASGAVSLFIIGLSLVVTTAYAMLMTASNTGMREMGFALATTVFTAALMASYLLTPIVVSMLGKHAWWPWGLRKKIEH